jgi:hypothetical protein
MSLASNTGNMDHEFPVLSTQNRFQVLDQSQNGVKDVFQNGESEWAKVTNHKKRYRISSGGNSGHDINIPDFESFENLSMSDKLSMLYSEMHAVGEKVNQCLMLQNKVCNIQQQMTVHEDRLTLLEYKSIDLEARSRRNNLIFGGIKEVKFENCANAIADFLKDYLGIVDCPPIPRAHRLGRYERGTTRAIIVYFLDFRDTDFIISKANKLKNTHYNINRDFPPEIVQARKVLWPKYKKLREEYPESKVGIVYPAKIIMDGKVVADMFPQWNLIMQGNRIDIGKPILTNIPPTQTRDSRARNDTMSTANRPRDNTTRERSRSTSSSYRPPRRVQSRSPRHRGPRNHAPERNRFEKGRTVSEDSRSEPIINRPWDMPPSASQPPRSSAKQTH